jgi:hypothetical protein
VAPLFCAAIRHCDLATSESVCEARVLDSCLHQGAQGSPLSLQQLDQARAQQCLDGITAHTASCSTDALNDVGNGCVTPVVGVGAEGSACAVGADCASRTDGGRARCVGPDLYTEQVACAGTCAAGAALGHDCSRGLPCDEGYCSGSSLTDGGYLQACVAFLGLNAPCTYYPEPCGPGMSCQGGAAGPTCQLQVRHGDPCVSDEACSASDRCVDQSGNGRTCVARLPLGAACAPSPDPCAPGLSCLNSQCVPRDSDLGGACGIGSDPTNGTSCRNSLCVAPPGHTVGTCVALPSPKLGDACTDTYCGGIFRCVNQVCVGLPAAGQPCLADTSGARCQLDSYCDLGGTCVSLVLEGAACTASSACLDTEYCNATGHCAPAKAPGAPCTPSELSCAGAAHEQSCQQSDGGLVCGPPPTDRSCLMDASGSYVCQQYCN